MDLTRTELKEQAESMGLYVTWYGPGGAGLYYKFSHVKKDYHALTHWEIIASCRGLKAANLIFMGYKQAYFRFTES